MGQNINTTTTNKRKYYYYTPKYSTQAESHNRRIKFAEYIIDLKENKGKSYAEIARNFEVSRQYISGEVKWYNKLNHNTNTKG